MISTLQLLQPLVSLTTVIVCLYLTAMYGKRLFKVSVQRQPSGFVIMQFLGAAYPALLILELQAHPVRFIDGLVLAWSALYLWRSRERMALYVKDAEAGVPKREMEDVSETRMILKPKSEPAKVDQSSTDQEKPNAGT